MSTLVNNREARVTETPPPGGEKSTAEIPITVIKPRPGWKALNLRELFAYRELLYFLSWRDVKIRYKQALLGACWAVIQPVMYMFVFSFVFKAAANVPDEGIPYRLFTFCALVPWVFFASAVTQASNSIVTAGPLITKVYFPRLAIPFASVGGALFDFLIGFGVLLIMVGYYYLYPLDGRSAIVFDARLLLVPPLILLIMLAALAVGTVLSALTVSYRDFKYTVPFMIQLWMFATPAIYMGTHHGEPAAKTKPTVSKLSELTAASDSAAVVANKVGDATPGKTTSSGKSSPVVAERKVSRPASQSGGGAVPDWIQDLLKYNPMNGVIRAFRAALLGQPIPWTHLGYSTVIIVTTFVVGCFYFHRMEDRFADII